MPKSKNQAHENTGDKINKKHPERGYLVCGAAHDNNVHGFCLQRAGWGTDHLGKGRCKLHGGKSTGPKNQTGNKNAVKTHEHESIWFDTLSDDEKDYYHEIRTDVSSQLDNEIKLTDIRIRRMMMRINDLKKTEFTIVERNDKSGVGPEGPVDVTEEKNRATLGQIQDIEEAITRVQTRKAKLIDIKHKVEQREGPIDPDISQYLKAIGIASGQVWNDKDEEEE